MYMITLDNFENFVPYKIWMRGEEYYETDAVSELEEISPGEWTATVEGTDDYNVEISMDGNEIESWYCDCPYDGESANMYERHCWQFATIEKRRVIVFSRR